MAISESGFERVEPDDPNRCQAMHASFQCPFRAVGTRNPDGTWDGAKYCPRHSGPEKTALKAKNLRLYHAAKWNTLIGEQADHPKVKTLREELGILRITLNNKLEQCKDEFDLAMNAGSIIEIVREIGKLANTAHHIEQTMGFLLDKNQALSWTQELITIISSYIHDPLVLQKISDEMIASLEARTSPRALGT